MKYDFSGYATKANLECSDGRVILPNAFKHNDGQTVPLVWQHDSSSPENILGHAVLENREDGVYTYGYFNETEIGKVAKDLVKHGDIVALSIHANKLKQKDNMVVHGMIREVSLVLAGANPEAFIDNVTISHGDGVKVLDDDAIIYHNIPLDMRDNEPDEGDDEMKKGNNEPTVKEVYDTFTEEEKEALVSIITAAASTKDTNVFTEEEKEDLKSAVDGLSTDKRNVFNYLLVEGVKGLKDTNDDPDEGEEDDTNVQHSYGGGKNMKTNAFTKQNGSDDISQSLSHAQFKEIVNDALTHKSDSLKSTFLQHSINNIDLTYPDATLSSEGLQKLTRDVTWVDTVLSNVKKSPFSRIKTITADLTAEEARAKGYIKGTEKDEQVFGLLKRTTSPATVYKKQSLDRDDILDITEYDIIAFLKMELTEMLNEELARAILIGDGRSLADNNKIKEDSVRPIWTDEDLFTSKVKLESEVSGAAIADSVMSAMPKYKGSGSPTMYMQKKELYKILVTRDSDGKRLYRDMSELAAEMGVSKIVPVEVMDDATRVDATDSKIYECIGIITNLKDYTLGAAADAGNKMFEDFDIDFNKQKYLIETRRSGALTKVQSAIAIERAIEAPAG